MKLGIVVSIVALAMTQAAALANPGHEPAKMPKEFDSLKQLVGTWEGKSMMGDKEETVTVVYELTSGGTALIEKLMPGTPHEMVSVYHKEGNSLGMTHYCSMGNQPHMSLKKADTKEISFEMTKALGISSMKEPHMHSVTMTFADADSMKEDWTQFVGGKKVGGATFNLKRKK